MGGICGIYSPVDTAQASQGMLAKMLAVIDPAQRGATHVFVDSSAGVALGRTGLPTMRRQACGGHPNWSEDKNHMAVLEGVIANGSDFLPVSEHDRRKGCASRGAVEYLRQAPLEFPAQLTGKFSLIVWSKKQGELWLVHAGGERVSFFYAYVPDVILLFASDRKSIVTHPVFSRAMNQKALADYMKLGYVPSPLHLLEGIQAMSPGEALRITGLGRMTARHFRQAHTH